MNFVVFVEGKTECAVLSNFVRPLLDSRLSKNKVGIRTVDFKGWPNYLRKAPAKAKFYQNRVDTLGIIGLLDLYGPKIQSVGKRDRSDYLQRMKLKIEKDVGQKKFRQHFAVHELEAWLFSEPHIFPQAVAKNFPASVSNPESVNHDRHPAKLLDTLYKQNLKRMYNKVTDGLSLFSKLDAEVVYDKCPHFRLLIDDMVSTARDSGL